MTQLPQVPVAFGHWHVAGNQLTCRLPRTVVKVNAPGKLLLDILHWCDGNRPREDVVAHLQAHWDAKALSAFLPELVRHGALVEASQLWAHWGDIAQLPLTMAVPTPAQEIGRLHLEAQQRLLPGQGPGHVGPDGGHLAALLMRRRTARTFDDLPISQNQLRLILWAAQGVTRGDAHSATGWHRTIASGGNMHSARWFVAVLRELPAQAPDDTALPAGIFEARFHQRGGVSLRRMAGDISDAWRCLRDPRVLRFASALLIPAADIAVPARKYGNRATLFALIEAGQSLQNAQLMAVESGLSAMLRGDTVAGASLRMLGLSQGPAHWVVAPAMVIGAPPTDLQVQQQDSDNVFKISPNLELLDDSFAFAASPAHDTGGMALTASGRSGDPKLALTKAEAEGWERLAWASPQGLQAGRMADMGAALDPRDIVAYSQAQYAQPDFAFQPFSPRRSYLWAQAIDTSSGATRAVLADCVYAMASLPGRYQRRSYTSASTSGMAAGATHQDALRRATLELIERDAFLRAWLGRRAPPALQARSLPRTTALRIAQLEALGFRIVASDISTSWVPVISVFGQGERTPLTAITAAAAFSPEQALDKALDEIEGRIAHAQAFGPPPRDDPSPFCDIERRYRSRRSFRQADFYVRDAPTIRFAAAGNRACTSWEQLEARLHDDGLRLLAVDMTPAGAAVDQGRTPLRVVRAMIPGLLPIWFEAGMQPEGLAAFIMAAGGAQGMRASRSLIHPFT